MENHEPIVLFDGVCNFCNGVVNFLLKQDKKKNLRFTAMQSEAGKRILMKHGFEKNYTKSFVLVENGKAFKKSTAALKLAHYLPWYWQWAKIFWIVPAFLRDGVYEFISNNRYKWFGKRESCRIPSAEERARFLD